MGELETVQHTLPPLSQSIFHDWPTEQLSLSKLKPMLISQLPFVITSKKKKKQNQDIITMYKTIKMTPVNSAKSRQTKEETLPNITVKNTTLALSKINSDFMTAVGQSTKRWHSPKALPENTIHLVSKKMGSQSLVKPVLSEAIKMPLLPEEILERNHKAESFYKHQKSPNLYCHNYNEKSNRLEPWRCLQKQLLIWECEYSPLQMHKNFKGNNPETVYLKKLEEFEKKWKPPALPVKKDSLGPYPYPSRFLAKEERMPIKPEKPPVQDEGSVRLDLLLSISELNYWAKYTIEQLEQILEKEESEISREKQKRYRESIQEFKRKHCCLVAKMLKKNDLKK
ncbi:hypothetical protein HDV04_004980 [Boothiomyces sp. JEL0838]|nr:hypothetical protein HDV04_004980 [Boothiomyces sp. JEL0838]